MSDTGFDLYDAAVSLRRHLRWVLVATAVAAVISLVAYVVSLPRYEAKAVFVLRNPLYGDRNNLYNYDTKFLDYFASEDDVNRILLLAESHEVQNRVIEQQQLAKAYQVDTAIEQGKWELERTVNKNLKIMRTEYRSVELKYTDIDQLRAAQVANGFVAALEFAMSNYYLEMRHTMYAAMEAKLREADSTIAALTDTLSLLRAQYGIYDIISPARNNLMLSSMKDNGKKDFGRGVELVQNFESLKDEVVTYRAKQTTLLSQYATGLAVNQMPMIKVITPARPPASRKGLGMLLTVIACTLAAFFFSAFLASLSDRIKTGKQQRRAMDT